MKEKIIKISKYLGATILIGFAVFGMILLTGYLAVYFGWSDVRGEIDSNSRRYDVVAKKPTEEKPVSMDLSDIDKQIQELTAVKRRQQRTLCQLNVVRATSPDNARNIINAFKDSNSAYLVDKMILAVDLHLKNPAFSRQIALCESTEKDFTADDVLSVSDLSTTSPNAFYWVNSGEWQSIKQAIIKDKALIESASTVAGIEPRMLVSALIVEQLRLYHTQREMFEKIFKPLSILANANKMAWGVMAIKEKTAISIEDGLRDSKSPFYLGEKYEHMLDFSTDKPEVERYERLTNEKDHYYSYLYGALYLKELMTQWDKAGYVIDGRPEILATLFNIGFKNSKPKEFPEVGGSTIKIGDNEYSFGSLAYEFYYSGELVDDFPFVDDRK